MVIVLKVHNRAGLLNRTFFIIIFQFGKLSAKVSWGRNIKIHNLVSTEVTSRFQWLTLFSACTYGNSSDCIFPCNCAHDGEVCDIETGLCPISGCKDGPPAEQDFRWSGPGCRIGERVVLSGFLLASCRTIECTVLRTLLGNQRSFLIPWIMDFLQFLATKVTQITIEQQSVGFEPFVFINYQLRIDSSKQYKRFYLCRYSFRYFI